ncbi:MAG: UvrD-helicase domain-containing protein, partial [Bacillota bacterium]
MKETDVDYRGDMTPTGPQREAITCPLGDVVVTAGPGSGKTRVLVGRMEYLLSRGVPPEKMAAITFTKRAAAEMKERLRTRLAERWVEARRDGYLADARHWRSLVWRIEGAYIGTIHGFCQSMLRDYPQSADLDPEFAVLDPYRRRLIMEDIIRRVVEEFLGTDRADFLRDLVDRRGHRSQRTHLDLVRGVWDDSRRSVISWEELTEITRSSLWERYRLSGGSRDTWIHGGLEEGDADIVEDTLEDLLDMHARADATRSKKYPPLIDAFATHWPRLRRFLRGPEDEAALEEILELLPEKGCPKAYKTHIGALHDLGRRCDLRRELAAAREMLDIMQEIDRRYGRAKDERGVLDFDDLQRSILRVLRCDGEMLSRVQSRYTHLLVDEFQDTDEVQW